MHLMSQTQLFWLLLIWLFVINAYFYIYSTFADGLVEFVQVLRCGFAAT